MNQKKSGWVDADKLIEQSHPDAVLRHYGISIPEQTKGNNYRISCLLSDCDSEKSSYGKFSIELSPPFRIHCFACGVRGNLFDLVWMAKHGKRPSGEKLRGEEFKEVIAELQGISNSIRSEATNTMTAKPAEMPAQPKVVQANTPLLRSDNERTREIVNLCQEGLTDPEHMTPAASRYWRQREFFDDLCEKWGISFLPNDAKGTLRGRVIYRIDNVAGDALAYAGRDPDYDARWATWKRTGKGTEPIKSRFPSEKFFRKGLEFYGQQAARLQEPGYKEAINNGGVLIVEGFNDVLALDHKQQPAIGAMSNRLTESQVEKAVRFARQLGGKVTVMFDRNQAGQQGQQDAIAKLAKHVPVLNGWIGYEGEAIEPEQMSADEWEIQRLNIVSTWQRAGG